MREERPSIKDSHLKIENIMTAYLSDNYIQDTIQGIQTWKDLTIYNGKTYNVRVVYDADGTELLVASDELLNDIHPNEWGEDEFDGFDPTNPKAAERVYDLIFFFTDHSSFTDNDEMLHQEMKHEHPDIFA